jgi:hypothetical protein
MQYQRGWAYSQDPPERVFAPSGERERVGDARFTIGFRASAWLLS